MEVRKSKQMFDVQQRNIGLCCLGREVIRVPFRGQLKLGEVTEVRYATKKFQLLRKRGTCAISEENKEVGSLDLS